MTGQVFLNGKVELRPGDCLQVLRDIPADSVDSVVTDPPYGLEFMGKGWDGADGFRRSLNAADTGRDSVFGRTSKRAPEYRAGHLFQEFIYAVSLELLRVLKPGGHLVAFGGTRTYHRLACAIEDAGFEIRDQAAWCYGQGFPKSLDVSKAIDKAAGAEREIIGSKPVHDLRNAAGGDTLMVADRGLRPDIVHAVTRPTSAAAIEWEGWGTALKPSWEPICVARKPLSEATVAANVLRWRTGAINIDACRVEGVGNKTFLNRTSDGRRDEYRTGTASGQVPSDVGRWPANIIHDGSDEVLAAFPSELTSGKPAGTKTGGQGNAFGRYHGGIPVTGFGDSGSAARFFYTAKADDDDRIGSKHPTVKPVDLMQWLARLVTPAGGIVLDPFSGTGTTGEAAWREGFRAILIEREEEYQADIARRMALCLAGPEERKRESLKAKLKGRPEKLAPNDLFASP
jgi:DNA modification methylase